MSVEAALKTVADLREAVHDEFPDSPRRAQFDSHLATVEMCIQHLHDEQQRHTDTP